MYGADLKEQELGRNGCNAEVAGGVPPLGSSEDIRDESSMSQGEGMGAVIGDAGLGGVGDVSNEGLHLQPAG